MKKGVLRGIDIISISISIYIYIYKYLKREREEKHFDSSKMFHKMHESLPETPLTDARLGRGHVHQSPLLELSLLVHAPT